MRSILLLQHSHALWRRHQVARQDSTQPTGLTAAARWVVPRQEGGCPESARQRRTWICDTPQLKKLKIRIRRMSRLKNADYREREIAILFCDCRYQQRKIHGTPLMSARSLWRSARSKQELRKISWKFAQCDGYCL